MYCPNCGFNNRQGVTFCEQCGSKLLVAENDQPSQVVNCQECGTVNPIGSRYCAQCGGQLIDLARPDVPDRKMKKKSKLHTSRRVFLGLVITLLIIFLFLMVLGMINPSQVAAPEYSMEDGPTMLLLGETAIDGSLIAQPGNFSVLLSDPNGLQRVELYADGELVASENPEGNQVVFSPQIDDLSLSVKEVFVRVVNTEGKTSHTAFLPVGLPGEDLAGEPKTGTLTIEPDLLNPPLPVNLVARDNEDHDQIIITWETSSQNETGSKVYLRFPGASGIILLQTLPAGIHHSTIAAGIPGVYEIFVSLLDLQGREGPLVSTSVDTSVRTGSLEVPSDINEDEITATHLQVTPNLNGLSGIYVYIQVGGSSNLFLRFPASQGAFITEEITQLTLEGFNWPISQPMPVVGEVWGYTESGAVLLSRINIIFQPLDMADGNLEYVDSYISVVITLDIQGVQGTEATETNISTEQPAITLPPPSGIHHALRISDCQQVASELGTFFNRTREHCINTLAAGKTNFILWDWPGEGAPKGISEEDLSGFEMRLIQTDDQGEVVGQNAASIPYPEARGGTYIPGLIECGVTQSWWMRAYGPGGVSEWVYAGSVPGTACDPQQNLELSQKGCFGINPEITTSSLEILAPVFPVLYLDYFNIGPISALNDELTDELTFFDSACNKHNDCYEQKKNKVDCDNAFLADMLLTCAQKGQLTLEIGPTDCKTKAYAYYTFYNSLPGRLFYKGNINPLDCLRAAPGSQYDCFLGASPEILEKGLDFFETAADITTNAVNKGWEETKSAGGKVLNGVVDVATDPIGTIGRIRSIW